MKNILITMLTVISFAVLMGIVTPSPTYATLLTIPQNTGYALSTVTGTYANSQTDTVYFYRNRYLSTLSFGIYNADSVSITSIVVRRIINGNWTTVFAGDTLGTSITSTTTNNKLYFVTLNTASLPQCDLFAFVIVYAGSANGVTTPNVTYLTNKTFYQ